MQRGLADWLAVTDGMDAAGLWGWVKWWSGREDVAGAVNKLSEQVKAWRRQL